MSDWAGAAEAAETCCALLVAKLCREGDSPAACAANAGAEDVVEALAAAAVAADAAVAAAAVAVDCAQFARSTLLILAIVERPADALGASEAAPRATTAAAELRFDGGGRPSFPP